MQSLILLMAGKGVRSGLDYNKMMYKINNKPLFLYTLDAFLKFKDELEIIIVCNENDFSFVKEVVPSFVKVVKGGSTRNESVLNGLANVTCKRVLIHDAARVLVSDDIIKSCLECTSDIYYVANDIKDTLREKDSLKTINRANYYSVQTPQGGNTPLFKEFEQYSTTDDISSFENNNINCSVIKGNDYNFKVTTEFDLKVIENLLKETK